MTTFFFESKQIKPVLDSLKKFRKNCGEKRLSHTLRIEIVNFHNGDVKFSIQGMSTNRFFQCILRNVRILTDVSNLQILLDYDVFENAMKGVKKEFEIVVDGEKVTLINGLVQVSLVKPSNEIDFEIPKRTPDTAPYFNLDKKSVLAILDSSEDFSATDALRPYFNGHYFECKGGELVTFVTDAHKLKNTKHKISSYSGDSGFLVPSYLIPIVREWVAKSFDYLMFEKVGKYIIIQSEEFRLFFLDEEAKRVEFEHVIPQKFNFSVILDKQPLLDAIKAVKPAINKTTKTVNLHFYKDTICVVGQDNGTNLVPNETPTYAWTDVKLNAYSGDEPLVIGFNSEYLETVLNASPSNTVTFNMNAFDRPVVVGFTVESIIQPILLMPVILSKELFKDFYGRPDSNLYKHFSDKTEEEVNRLFDSRPFEKQYAYIRNLITVDELMAD
jgi:DNA polymerase III sliding clamp (beta) subunit (PCNA family)